MIHSDKDEKYILNLAAHVIRRRVFSEIHLDKRGNLSGGRLYKLLQPIIAPELREMTNETLGRICGFATPHGMHGRGHFRNGIPFFRHNTGLADLPAPKLDPRTSPFRAVMEEVAVLVIICVARDIRLQLKWQEEAGVHHKSVSTDGVSDLCAPWPPKRMAA